MKYTAILALALGLTADAAKVKLIKKSVVEVESFPGRPSNNTKVHVGSEADSMCDLVSGDIPSFCSCADEALGGTMTCTVDIEFGGVTLDTVGVILDIEPCADPATVSFEMTEATLGIDYTYGYSTGDSEMIPVPDLSVDIPGLGGAGVYMDVIISGNADSLSLSVGIDACIDIGFGVLSCASDLDSADFPIWMLDSAYDFSDVCE